MFETLQCNECGAPLETPSVANFIRCNHCGANLAVRRSESTTFTEAIEKLHQTTEGLVQRVDLIARQNEVAELDRNWQIERESFMISTKRGQRLPDEPSGIGAAFAAVFGVFWTLIAFVAFPPMALFGIFFVIAAIFNGIKIQEKATAYKKAEENYRRRRAVLTSEQS